MTSPLAVAHELLGVAASGYAVGVLAALAARGTAGRALTAAGALAGATATLALGLWCLGTGATPALELPWLPLTGMALRIDGLSAFFLVVVGLTGAAAAVYGFGYTAHEGARYSLRLLGATLNLLLLSLTVQVIADNALTFLLMWEVMSLAAYVLVLTAHDHAGTVRAANWYLGVTHAGFAALVAAFLLLSAGDPAMSFEGMRAAVLPSPARDTVFVLALLGFGAKAGIVPLHVWLPMAHPVAPSHVSALIVA
jgi:hydrogenase-4 component B